MAKFNQMVKEFRESIGQSPEAIALLLDIRPEEYQSLEKDWIPKDDLLEKICGLFRWNFQEIRRVVQNGGASKAQPGGGASSKSTGAGQTNPSAPPGQAAPAQPRFSLGDKLIQARTDVGQPAIAIATLMNIPLDLYESYEAGTIPPDEQLRKICSMYGWNYREVRQKLINHGTVRMGANTPPIAMKDASNRPRKEGDAEISIREVHTESLGQRMQRVRNTIGQTPEGVALLLKIDIDYYHAIEQGQATPDPELLRHIASLFKWNFNELKLLVYNESHKEFQPRVQTLKPLTGEIDRQMESALKAISTGWRRLPKSQKEVLLAQLELIRDAIPRLAKQSRNS